MKGLWAGGLTLALGSWAAGTAAASEQVRAAQGVSLGRPVAAATQIRVERPSAPPAQPRILPVSFQLEEAPPAVMTRPGAPVPQPLPSPLTNVAPATLPAPDQPVGTSFATESRVFGQPLVVARTPSMAATQELVPASATFGVEKYVTNVRQVLGLEPATGQPVWETPLSVALDDWALEPHRWYGSAEFLLWWTKGSSLPALVTTGPDSSQGILGREGTIVLFGGNRQELEERTGGRFRLGWWCDPCQELGVEATYFFLGRRAQRFAADSNSFPLLARPFFNLNSGIEFSEVTTRPGDTSGSVRAELPNKLWGLEGNLRRNLCRSCGFNIDLLAGVRYLEMEEGLGVFEDVTLLRNNAVPGFPAGTRAFVFDQFDTRNQFYGGQVGARAELRRGPWFLDLRGSVALGNTHQVVNINGGQVFTTPPGAVSTFQGGLLALPSNIGNFSRDRFSVVPELGVNLGYHVTPRLRLSVGYTFLYWSNVLRPADQIDRVLDVTQIPNFQTGNRSAGLGRPLVPFRSTDFWAQGLNFGLEFRY